MNTETVAVFLLIIVVAIAIILVYMLPAIIAFRRVHPNRWIILLINVVFGGTLIGWGLALIWSMRAFHRVGSVGGGGESGLNLFVNDVKKMELVPPPLTPIVPPPLPSPSPVQDLEILQQLLSRGTVTQEEFDILKSKLLARA